MTSLLLFALVMFPASSSLHTSIKWEVCYQQHRWGFKSGSCYLRDAACAPTG
jgi:hypothetical protein